MSNLKINLRFACSTRKSVSEICRDIGINRQQFNRYLNGEAEPSPYNLIRIAGLFDLTPEQFHGPTEAFRQFLVQSAKKPSASDGLLDAFPGDISALRRHLGYYQTYHLSLSWPGQVVCSCVRVEEANGVVTSKSIERIRDLAHDVIQLSKYSGMLTFWRNRIFMVERSMAAEPLVAQTILTPFEIHQKVYLKGVTMGVSWRNGNRPYASRMIWRYLGRDTDRRAMLKRCGTLEMGHRQLPATVREFLESGGVEPLTIPE